MNGLALCAGIGGIELGLKLAVGENYRTICYVEREAYAAAALVARMEDAALDCAPIWDDITTFDGRHWRGIVDIITAGFPCQPFSCAGKREGVNDDRWLWPDIERIIRQVRPGYVFLENVPGLFTSGFGHVLGSLASLGFDAEWDVFSAAGVGAPHLRKRIFMLAYSKSIRWEQWGPEFEGEQGRPYPFICGSLLADAAGSGERAGFCDQGSAWERGRESGDGGVSDALCDAISGRCKGHPRRSPGPEPENRLWWASEPDVGRVAYGIPHRVDRLRALGNGVVPLVAAVAFRTLVERIIPSNEGEKEEVVVATEGFFNLIS